MDATAIRFGKAMHSALRDSFYGIDPMDSYRDIWHEYYGCKGWDEFLLTGMEFIGEFKKLWDGMGLTPVFTETRLSVQEHIVQPDFVAITKDGGYVVGDFKFTETPVIADDVYRQMVMGAYTVAENINNNEPVDVVVFNFVKSTKVVNIIRWTVTKSDIENLMAKRNEINIDGLLTV